ncbi:phosphoribosyltransferase [Fertoebacter nigrum]|uniref:Phosphoribosyltransferase n=1 Tax=Fertoeibacter niger TaxID=2656921 RepID=A0A8X8KQ29_9RHOB|nr:phosphoribosyltransferase [Fertoeibacter niger]NUB45750.1 phosphoribosyltransferase [Fertoeibacter niger]
MTFAPLDMWQELYPPGTWPEGPLAGQDVYAATLPDGRQILLPIRVLPGGAGRAVASLILNQASFAVLDALCDAVVAALEAVPAVVVGLPTLGLPLAEGLARRLGHARMVPLSTSRKFWYDDALSEPISSITSPGQMKRLYLDPRMLPLLADRPVLLVDDVISTGTSIAAALRLLSRARVMPGAIAAAMMQGEVWRDRLAETAPSLPVTSAIRTPILGRGPAGWLV